MYTPYAFILKKNFLKMMKLKEKLNKEVPIRVRIDNQPFGRIIYLNLKDNLLTIRKKLKDVVQMNVTLSFAKKAGQDDFDIIVGKQENNFILSDIVETIENGD